MASSSRTASRRCAGDGSDGGAGRGGAPRRLVRYLSTFEGDTRGEAGWAARLGRFWDENPTPGPRGWVLLDQARVVGLLALIPFLFQVDGAEVPGVASSTWRVDRASGASRRSCSSGFAAWRGPRRC
ncbi:MAG: hypothetical protein R3F43_13095 [bacterium]